MSGDVPVRGVAPKDHIDNIRKAFELVQSRLPADFPKIEVRNPSGKSIHDVNEYVLSNIDVADFGIADLSTNSPNVFYELSFMHSLGMPVITFAYKEEVSPWYSRSNLNNEIDDYQVGTIAAALEDDIRTVLSDQIDHALFVNPISKNYDGMSLAEVSAASGLALGHYMSFLHFALDLGNGPLRSKCVDNPAKFEDIIIVRPNSVREVEELEIDLKEQLKLSEDKLEHPSLSRPRTFAYKNKTIVDFPRPLVSLMESYRYSKIIRMLSSTGRDSEVLKIEEKWIDFYFQCIENEVRRRTGIFKTRLKVMKKAQLIDHFSV
jgi:hypothetical protein